MKRLLITLAATAIGAATAAHAKTDYVPLKPLTEMVRGSVQDCSAASTLSVPGIAWGADAVLSYANGNANRTAPGSIMADLGLDLEIYRQDDAVQQLEDYLACRTPFLRMTVGMAASASDVLNADPRTAPVFVFKYSWSNGGDAMVAREDIRTIADLRGKTIAVQYPGPHVDYLLKLLADAGIDSSEVTIKYVTDLIYAGPDSNSPANALLEDSGIDAAMVIIPDALTLTSDGTVGTGAEGSVKGAQIMLTTRTASRVVGDVYIVRRDYFDANRDQVKKFVSGLLQANERFSSLMKAGSGSEYDEAISAAAEFLLDSRKATADAVAMYADAEMDGFAGNVRFFADAANPRGFAKLTEETQALFFKLGILQQVTPPSWAQWDYSTLTAGLSDTDEVELPRFDTVAVTEMLERRARQQSDEDGVLYTFPIYFQPKQAGFSASQYEADFTRVMELASTYAGSILAVEGHSDPLGYLKRKKAGAAPAELSRLRQAGKNLSYGRANAVVDAIIAYANVQGVTMDPSQFGPIGYGYSRPNTPNCSFDAAGDVNLDCAPASKAEWDATRRVVFKIIQVEAESDVFSPL